MHHAFRFLFLAVAGTALALPAQRASVDTTTLAPVVVTATRVAVPNAAATASTTVLEGADLRARGITSVAEALRQVPDALPVRTGSFGSVTSLFLRGGESDYVEVLLDGVPLNEPGGAIDLANLTTDDVERIEIVRGPASVLYGANAVAGVIQIFTRTGQGPARLEASARAGTYGTREGTLALRGGPPRAAYSLEGAVHNTDGIFAFNSQARDNVVAGRVRLVPDSATTIALTARYIDAGAHIATDFTGAPVDSNQFHTERRWVSALDLTRALGGRVVVHALLGATQGATRSADLPDSPGDTNSFPYDAHTTLSRRSADAHVDVLARPDLVVTGGASAELQREHLSIAAPLGRTVHAAYAQLAGESRRLSYTAGVRVDHNSAFGTFASWRGGAAYRLPTGTTARLALGTAFKEPTFEETSSSAPYDRGNPSLRPERSRSWEAGLAQRIGAHATVGATYFAQRFRDLVQYDAAPADTSDPNYVNVAAANASGLESAIELALPRGFSLRASQTWLRTRVIDAGVQSGTGATFVAGQRLLRRPSLLASARFGWTSSHGGSAHLDLTHVGARSDRDFATFPATPVTLPAYTTVDVAGEWPLPRTLGAWGDVALTARAENLFDARYEQIFGFATPRRTMLVGARIGRDMR